MADPTKTYTVIHSALDWTDRLVADIVAVSDADDSIVVFRRHSNVSDLAEGRDQARGRRHYDGWTLDGSAVTIETIGRYEPTSEPLASFSARVTARRGSVTPGYLTDALNAAARALCSRPSEQ